jgi:hypothetical protein
MSTQIDARNLGRLSEAPLGEPDKSGWTDLQHIQYMIGIWDGVDGHPVVPRELPPWEWVPNEEWRKLRGILSDHPKHDTTEALRADRVWELEHDKRKFGG